MDVLQKAQERSEKIQAAAAIPDLARLQEPLRREMRACSPASRLASSQDGRPRFALTARELLRQCKVPDLYQGWKVEAFTLKAIPWRNGERHLGGGVLIKGPVGTGKSCLAAALLRDRIMPEHPFTLSRAIPDRDTGPQYALPLDAAKWVRCGALLFAARGAFRDGGTPESELICQCVEPDLLVLDDLCSGKTTDSGWTLVSEIIGQRVDAMRDTIVTTNLTLEEIHAQEPRLASRLAAFLEIVLDGQDRRIANA